MSGCSQKVTSTNTISYINDSELKIDKIRDGAGGEYLFVYNNGDVSEIQYRGKGKNIIKKVISSNEIAFYFGKKTSPISAKTINNNPIKNKTFTAGFFTNLIT